MMQRWCTVLRWLGIVLGAIVIIYGIARFLSMGSLPCLFIALAVVFGGPVEDIATRWVGSRREPNRAHTSRKAAANIYSWKLLVDLSTSIAFLVCLGLAEYFS